MMCDNSIENLIDFNFEETPAEYEAKPLVGDQKALIPSPRLSLENNPFDSVQKLTLFRPDDPFDIVEKEASLKAREIRSKSVEVKLGNLLSLSEDSEISPVLTIDSNVYHTAEEHELENESPPTTLSSKWSPCSSTASCESSDSNKDPACGAKVRKTRNHRNRLLKLSISNAAFSTPNSSRPAPDKDDCLKNVLTAKLVCLPGENEESSIESESPVKLIDEDSKSEIAKEKNYTEQDFDHDLEMMEIPILRQLPSPKKINNKKDEGLLVNDNFDTTAVQPNSKLNQLPDLDALRQKLRTKRLENNHKEVSDLINDFKNLINKSKMIDEHNKHEVDGLLETLTSTLFAAKTSPKETSQDTLPQPIVRQSTFDIDLSDKEQLSEDHATEPIGNPACVEDMPDAMLKSSATYDGETTEDKAHLNLPQIDPPSPDCKQSLDANFKDIIEQLQEFLEHQHLPIEHSDVSKVRSGSMANTNNPTVIVVMPTIAPNSISEESYDTSCSYRRRSQSLSLHDKLKIVQLPIKIAPEIQVTESNESPPLNASCYQTPNNTDFKTPARFLERRNTFSSASLTPSRFSKVSQSIIGKDRTSGVTSTTPIRTSKLGLHSETRQPALVQRPNFSIKPDPKNKVRTTSSLLKSNAPLKATLPYKQVVSAVKSSSNSTSSISASTSNTSMHLVARAGHISHTSTPMPVTRSSGPRTSNKLSPNFSSASNSSYSTRLSNIAKTPVAKTLSAPTASTANLRRRTISEFKAKSPNKMRNNTLSIKSNSSRPLINQLKNTLRPTVGASHAHAAIKNKENKEPQN